MAIERPPRLYRAKAVLRGAVCGEINLGGDADTQAAIAGSIAAAYYGKIPDSTLWRCMKRLPGGMRQIIRKFDSALEERYGE